MREVVKRAIKSAIEAALYIIFFITIPNVVVGFLPTQAIEQMGRGLGIQTGDILFLLAAAGIVLAALSIAKNMTDEQSPINLTAAVAGSIVTFYVMIYFLGLGNPSAFGMTTKNVDLGEGGTGVIMLDLRFIAAFAAVLMVLKIVHAVLAFYEAR